MMQDQYELPIPNDDYIKEMTDIANMTFPGLAMFVRDVNLSKEIEKKYIPNMIIKERAFVDASYRVMGMITSHRFAILLNSMANIEQYEHGTNWGLCISPRDSYFKVLAVHEYCGKTCIVLLHLPDGDDWKMFANTKINLVDEMTATSIERFENKCTLDPIPELCTDEWLQRCSFPIGMDDNGNFFDLE